LDIKRGAFFLYFVLVSLLSIWMSFAVAPCDVFFLVPLICSPSFLLGLDIFMSLHRAMGWTAFGFLCFA